MDFWKWRGDLKKRPGAGLHRSGRRRPGAVPRFRIVQGAPLAKVKTLLAGASLFVGNDSGPAHMAAAFGLPVGGDLRQLGPRDLGPVARASEVVTAPGGIAR
jgi:hypothetical protein